LGAQQEEQKHSGKGLLKNDQGIYMTKEGAFYVPNIPPSLRIRLMVVAHAQATGSCFLLAMLGVSKDQGRRHAAAFIGTHDASRQTKRINSL
jgi:hypothetical protein